MNPSCILMCTNIPRGVNEDVLIELFCIAGPVEDISISRSRSCFVIYEFPESVPTAKEIFQDVLLSGRPLEMFDECDIKQMHEKQEQESADLQQKEAAYAEVARQYNPFYNNDSMTPNYRNNLRGRGISRNFPPPQNLFDPAQNHFNMFPNQFNSPRNQFNLPPFQNQFTPPQFPNQFTPPPFPNNFNPLPPPPQNQLNSPQNHSYGDNYDPSVPSRRWGSAPETNHVQPLPPDSDLFKSPYSQPVSRKNYEQSRKNDDDVLDVNYTNRTNCFSKRHPEQSPHDSTGKKSYRDDNRYNNSKQNSDSRSDYSNRHKSRDYERSSGRNDYRRNDRRNDYHNDKQHRNHRR